MDEVDAHVCIDWRLRRKLCLVAMSGIRSKLDHQIKLVNVDHS